MHYFLTYIHPSAFISSTAVIGVEKLVLQNCVIQSNSTVGANSILNIGSMVDHDVEIGDYSYIAPNVYIRGRAKIPTLIGLYPSQVITR